MLMSLVENLTVNENICQIVNKTFDNHLEFHKYLLKIKSIDSRENPISYNLTRLLKKKKPPIFLIIISHTTNLLFYILFRNPTNILIQYLFFYINRSIDKLIFNNIIDFGNYT